MIRVLQVLPALDGGGVDKLLADYCMHMDPDIQFDFAVSAEYEGILEAPLRSRGCAIYHLAQNQVNPKLRFNQLQKIIKDNSYSIVHDHTGYRGVLTLLAANLANTECRISHSHISHIPETSSERAVRFVCTAVAKLLATHLFACGEEAAKWMWGKQSWAQRKVHIMPNAIQMQNYTFSQKERDEVRHKLGLENKFVVGNVARLSEQKNHRFLLEIFKEVKARNKDALLLLIGRGELMDAIRLHAKQLDIENDVLFLGVRKDVPSLLNAMDVFVLPSKYEGLPVVLVEAQSNGLPIVLSSIITSEAQLPCVCNRISLDKSPEVWAEAVINARRADSVWAQNELKQFDIARASKELSEWYFAHARYSS